VQLKTFSGKTVDPKDIDQILREGIMGVEETTVLLKNGQKEFLVHPEKEVLDEMNRVKNG
jgi:hypothetical protein